MFIHEVTDAISRELFDGIIEFLIRVSCAYFMPREKTQEATDPGFPR